MNKKSFKRHLYSYGVVHKIENKLMSDYGAKFPEVKALLEKKRITESLNVSPEVQEIKKSRRL